MITIIRIMLTSLILFTFTNLYSQDQNSISEIRKNTYQVELGFRSIESIWANTSAATILFKKKIERGNMVNLASVNFVRAYFSINTQINFEDDPTQMSMDSTEIRFHPADIVDFTVGLGIEKQYQNRRFVHYFGADLFTQYFKSDDDFPINSSFGGVAVNSTGTTDRYVRTLNSGFNPFFGIKYYISDQLSVGLESGFRLTYFNSRFQEVRTTTIIDSSTGIRTTEFEELEPVSSNGFRFNFLGVRFITLGYSFK